MSVRFQRLLIIFISLILLSSSIALILINSKKNIIFFYTPTELSVAKIEIGEYVRIGGFVKKNTLIKNKRNNYLFIITDNNNDVNIEFNGILPDLFKEEKGAVVEGILVNPIKINAKNVFAKHDENYMPKSIKKQLEQTNYWKRNY